MGNVQNNTYVSQYNALGWQGMRWPEMNVGLFDSWDFIQMTVLACFA